MTLSADKLRAIVNLLADPMQAHAVAHRLTKEAKARGVLVADLIGQTLAPPSALSLDDVAESEDDPATALGQCGDGQGRTIFIIPAWLIRRKRVGQ